MWRTSVVLALAALAKVRAHEELPEEWYEVYAAARARNERRNLRRLLEIQPLPAKLPEKGDPEEVNILVIGDWGTYPGTGINMGTDWDVTTWNSVCFYGSSSPKAWKEQKVTTGEEVQKSWGNGRPICGSMHIECSWGGGDGRSMRDRCNPDKDAYWRDHFAQQNVATSMTDLAQKRHPSFVINTADNFYYYGVTSTKDKMWSMMFEELYTDESLQIPWLGSLGNHDYGGHTCDVCLFKTDGKDTRRDRPCSQAMIDYDTEHDWQWPSDKEVRWVMPMKGEDRWYMKSFNFKKANVTLDVFVIDTNKAHISSQCRGGGGCPGQAREKCISFFMRLWTRQREWLLPALEKSKADWKWVVGHAPPENFEESLMEEMRDRGVSVYMAGHVHQLRHDQHPSGIEVIISGSGGGYQSAGGGTAYTLHESMDYGFAAINVKPTQLTVEYWNDQGQRLWDPIIVPAKDLVKEGLLKKLRTAALQSDVDAMKDGIAKAKEYGVEERLIFAAAIAGIKAFEAEGGLAWVYLQPKIMKTGAARTSAMLASWTTEDSLPGTATQLVLPDKCCSSSGQSFESTQSVLCYASKEQCSGEQMAFNMAKRGAGAMLWASKRQLLANETSNPDLAEAFNLPAASIPESFVKDIPSWLGNKDEVIFISYTGGKKGFDDAVEHARSAGVPEELINAAIQNGARRRAKEHVQTAAKNENQTEIKEALDEAQEVQAEGDIINEAKRKLEILQLEDQLVQIQEECKDFDSVHDVIQRAEAFEILNTTLMNSAEGCRLQLAVDALDAAVKSGTQCKERLEVAVAWCRLAHAPEAVIESAEIDCEVKAKTHHSALLVVVVLILAAGAGVFLWLCSKSQQATAPTTRSNPGGIELLETDAS